jgi:DNA mismatch endonuclease (patch repair protein)
MTAPERMVSEWLDAWGQEYVAHCRLLPGTPDFYLPGLRVVVFVDGRIWHDPRYAGRKKDPRWRLRAALTRKRDRKVTRALYRRGLAVIRIWDSALAGRRRRAWERERVGGLLRRLAVRRLLQSSR